MIASVPVSGARAPGGLSFLRKVPMMRRTMIVLVVGYCFGLIACGAGVTGQRAVPASGSGLGSTTVEGTLVARELTGFQYGSDLLVGSDGRTLYVLRAGVVDLVGWRGRSVRVIGKPVAGYPLDGGPPLLEVAAVEPLGP